MSCRLTLFGPPRLLDEQGSSFLCLQKPSRSSPTSCSKTVASRPGAPISGSSCGRVRTPIRPRRTSENSSCACASAGAVRLRADPLRRAAMSSFRNRSTSRSTWRSSCASATPRTPKISCSSAISIAATSLKASSGTRRRSSSTGSRSNARSSVTPLSARSPSGSSLSGVGRQNGAPCRRAPAGRGRSLQRDRASHPDAALRREPRAHPRAGSLQRARTALARGSRRRP